MNYVSIFDNVNQKRLCFLENAFDVGYTLNLNKLHEAKFSLPLDDPKNRFCQVYRWVEIWDGDTRVGLFRILPTKTTKTPDTRKVEYTCEHVLATLMDDVMFGWHEIGNVGVYTNEVLSYVLGQQRTRKWYLLRCDFRHQFLYGWENENLLSALFSVANCFGEGYTWTYDTSDLGHWNISLEAVDPKPVADVRYKKNIKGITKTSDPSEMATRLIPLGYGEGVNQLDISKVNNGSRVLTADTVDTYGEITRVWVDRRYQDANSLKAAASAMLEEMKRPYISYEVDAASFGALANAKVGQYVRVVDDEDGTDFLARVIQIQKNDVYGDPAAAKITLANRSKDIATSLADMADRSRVNETYAQGAVTVYTMSFADNASPQRPATMRFPIPENVVHINSIVLDGQAEPFRGYTSAVSSTTINLTTTSSGGGGTSGASSSSSSTSSAVSLLPQNMLPGPEYADAVHNHGIADGVRLATVNNNNEITGSVGWTPSGAHIHGAHTHTVNFAHTHQISAHTHGITMPSHSHSMDFGIYEGTTASTLKIGVDGTTLGTFSDLNNKDITQLLTAVDGEIVRGWHTLTITPDKLTRVNVSLSIQLFANSRGGGGQY